MDKVKKLPALRFPGFSGDWEVKKLGDACNGINSGKTKPELEGDFYVYGSTGIIGKSKNFTHSGKYLLIARVGANAGTINKVNDKFSVTDNTLVLDVKVGFNIEYLYFVLLNFDLNKLVFGSGQPLITGGQLKILKISFPEIAEQQQIADFISQVDKKIEQLTKKKNLLESYKKGAMQKIFSQELRFKDDNGEDYPDWEEKRLGEISSFHRGADLSKSDIVENGLNKCIHYGELFTMYVEVINKIFSYTNKDNLVKSKIGDILMPSSDVTPQGLAKASCIMEDNVILGGDINIIRPNNLINSIFLSYQLNYLKYEIIKLVTGTTVKHIYFKDIKELLIKVPESKDEQTKIANFLIEIDNKIKYVTKQLEGTKQFKKSLLQKMFI